MGTTQIPDLSSDKSRICQLTHPGFVKSTGCDIFIRYPMFDIEWGYWHVDDESLYNSYKMMMMMMMLLLLLLLLLLMMMMMMMMPLLLLLLLLLMMIMIMIMIMMSRTVSVIGRMLHADHLIRCTR